MTGRMDIAKGRARGDLDADDDTFETGRESTALHSEDLLGHHPLALEPPGARTPHGHVVGFLCEHRQAVRDDQRGKPEVPDHPGMMGLVHM